MLVKVILAIESQFVKGSRNSFHFEGHDTVEWKKAGYWGTRGRQACWSDSS